MEYFPPEGLIYPWGNVRQSQSNPYRNCHVEGLAYPQMARLICWETEKGWYQCDAAFYSLDSNKPNIKVETKTRKREADAILLVEAEVANLFEQDTPSWAKDAVAAGWRPPCQKTF